MFESDDSDEKKEKNVHLGSGGPDFVEIKNISYEQMKSVINGMYYLAVENGKPVLLPRLNQPPEKVDDEELLPFWNGSTRVKDVRWDKVGFSMPSIIIQHLCGYNYTKERYEKTAEILESWGFECMRSRRGKDDGMYWEMWVLHGDWSAEGSLKDYIDKLPEKESAKSKEKRFDDIRHWINEHLPWGFGSMDIVIQRMAMSIDDGE